mgnify:CR=1 FL=1
MTEGKDWERIYRTRDLKDIPWERGKPREILVKFIEEGKIPKGKALDVCCGAGTQTVFLAEQGFEVACNDLSETAIEYAKEKAENSGSNNKIEFYNEDFMELPFENGTFDFVLDSGCFHHVKPENRDRYIEEVHRVLKNKGKYFLLTFSHKNGPAWNNYSGEQLREFFSEKFRFLETVHIESKEGDEVPRYFYNILMEKR